MSPSQKLLNGLSELGIQKMQEHLDYYIELVNKGDKSFSEALTSLDYRYDLEFIKNKTKWGSQVQGSFRKLSEHDYNVIANEIRKRIENE